MSLTRAGPTRYYRTAGRNESRGRVHAPLLQPEEWSFFKIYNYDGQQELRTVTRLIFPYSQVLHPAYPSIHSPILTSFPSFISFFLSFCTDFLFFFLLSPLFHSFFSSFLAAFLLSFPSFLLPFCSSSFLFSAFFLSFLSY